MTNEPAELVDAARLHIDDDRNHHFSKEIGGRIMVSVSLRFGAEFLAGARDAATADGNRWRRHVGLDDKLLHVDVESLGKPDQLVISEAHLAVLELRQGRVG